MPDNSQSEREISVRQAGSSDLGTLVALMHDFYAESGFVLDHQAAESSFLELLRAPALGAIWVAFCGGEPIGHAVLTVRYTMEHAGSSAYIDDLYVQPASRRKGAAGALLSALFEDSVRRGCKFAFVEVGETNGPARRLYESLGLHSMEDGRILLSGRIPGGAL